MEFIKALIKNKRLVWQLGKSDFKNRFASTGLGSLWGFLQPFIFMATYVIVFQFILKSKSSDEYPYLVWFLPGMAIWMWLNDSIISASSSIRAYSYLVKKVVFPIDVIPAISIVSSSFVSLFLVLVATIVCTVFGFIPNILKLVYVIFATYCFIIAFTRFSSAVTTMVPDFANLLGIVMQLFFWFTPIVWDLSMLVTNHPIAYSLVKCVPFTYLITALREVFISESIITVDYGMYTVIFWIITIIMYIWGNSVFNRNKKDFADVL